MKSHIIESIQWALVLQKWQGYWWEVTWRYITSNPIFPPRPALWNNTTILQVPGHSYQKMQAKTTRTRSSKIIAKFYYAPISILPTNILNKIWANVENKNVFKKLDYYIHRMLNVGHDMFFSMLQAYWFVILLVFQHIKTSQVKLGGNMWF
jgi:hypothetical protein